MSSSDSGEAKEIQVKIKSKSDYVEEAKSLAMLISSMDVSEADSEDGGRAYKSYVSYQSERNSHFVWLVSSKWFQLWKEKTRFDNLESGLDLDEDCINDDILPRLNEDLLDKEVDLSKFVFTKEEKFDIINTVCRPGLVEIQDFMIVTKAVWNFITKQYPDAIELKRIAYKSNGNMKYETNLTTFYFHVLSNEKLKWVNEDPNNYLQRRKMQISRRFTCTELKEALEEPLKNIIEKRDRPQYFGDHNIALFLLDKGEAFKTLKKKMRKLIRTNASCAMIKDIPIAGQELESSSEFLAKFNFQHKSRLIVILKAYSSCKFKSKYQEDASSDDGEGFTTLWMGPSNLGSKSRMGTIDPKFQGFPDRGPQSKLGHVGLRNLGNTCFMNSALQCLSHTKDLVDFLLTGDYKLDKNEGNPIGSKCKLLEAFAELIYQAWNNKHDVIPPSKFKYEMSTFKTMFDGFSQHDSQEFLSELLDGLHEDLNMIQKKPYVEKVEGSPQDEDEIKARESWITFLKRNYSKIVNLFYGQFKSEVKCPACDRTVISYDEYQLISLAVPKMVQKMFECYYISENQNSCAKTVYFKATYVSTEIKPVDFLKESFARDNGGTKDDYIVCFIGFTVHGFLVEDDSSLQKFIMQTKEKKFLPKAFIFKLDEIQKQKYHSPTSIRTIGILEQELKGKIENPGFNQIIFIEPEQTIEELYFYIFKKYAHFHCYDEKGFKQTVDDREHDEPLPEVDYEYYFKNFFLKPDSDFQFFYLMVNDLILPISQDITIADLIKENPEQFKADTRTFKFQIRLSTNFDKYMSLGHTKKTKRKSGVVSIDHHQQDKQVDLYTLLNAFRQPEQLDEQNTWYCSNCKEHVKAFKKIDIYKAPKNLIVHMKKLKEETGILSYTVEKPHNVDFPLDGLDMTEYVLNKKPISDYHIKKEEFIDPENTIFSKRDIDGSMNQVIVNENHPKLIYDCYAVINHYGSSYFGHYTAYVKRNASEWYCADDSSFSKTTPNSVVTEAAYVLFYRLREGQSEDPNLGGEEAGKIGAKSGIQKESQDETDPKEDGKIEIEQPEKKEESEYEKEDSSGLDDDDSIDPIPVKDTQLQNDEEDFYS